MKTISIFLFCIILTGLMGCSGIRHLDGTQPGETAADEGETALQQGETAFREENYQKTLLICEELISDPATKELPERGRIYELAGNSAFALEQFDKSQIYLETAQRLNSSSELTCLNLISIFHRIGNVSREITLLQTYMENYPSGTELKNVRERLFHAYHERSDYDLAVDLWPSLDEEARSDPSILDLYLEANKALKNDSVTDLTAELILEQYPENESALTWLAKKYYRQAENRYQAEMKAYNNNKTQRQYEILLEALKQVTVDFKESLGYFTRLYKLDQDPEYAIFLGNIYARLGDEKTANFYRRLNR